MSNIRVVVSAPHKVILNTEIPPRKGIARWRSPHENGFEYSVPGVFMSQQAYLNINQHAASTLDVEVGGMLIGQAYQSPAGMPYIVIESSLEAQHVNQSGVHLTFTSDTLADLLARLEETYQGKQIVGWYHTHPGLSVFLSPMDVWLHRNFFTHHWQVALVVDPRANQGGFFVYDREVGGHLNPRDYIGFYELGLPGADSVVTWVNLEPDGIKFTGRLWEQNKLQEDRLP